jgi:tripartite-type tricarboxylate transporter receptor subunit TctC
MTILFHALRRRSTLLAGLAALVTPASGSAQAQAYPGKPIRLLVGYSAGGGDDAMARLMAPHLSIGVVSVTSAIAQAKAGKLRALAVMSPVKLAGAEDVAPLADAVPGFDAAPRLFLLAPAGTPAAIVERLSEATRSVMAAPDLAQAAALQGAVLAYMAAGPLASDMPRESAQWAKVIREQRISAE